MNKKNMFGIGKIYLMFVLLISALVIIIAIYVPGIVKVPPVIAPPEIKSDIVVEELEDGKKLVKNVKEGFSVVVPEGFGVEIKEDNKIFSLYSSEIIKNNGEEEFMCKISSLVENKKTNLNEIKNGIILTTAELFTIKSQEFELVNIAGHEALKNILDTMETEYSISVHIPTDEKIYEFVVYSNANNKEKCTEYFNNFLETVIIDS